MTEQQTVTEPQLEILSDFYIKRSGASFTLTCGPCSCRCGSWHVLNLADVVANAARHATGERHRSAVAAKAT